MQILDQHLAKLVANRIVTKEEALLNCADMEQFKNFLKGAN
jgi:Tfp pilus assembly ATPase PilU